MPYLFKAAGEGSNTHTHTHTHKDEKEDADAQMSDDLSPRMSRKGGGEVGQEGRIPTRITHLSATFLYRNAI